MIYAAKKFKKITVTLSFTNTSTASSSFFFNFSSFQPTPSQLQVLALGTKHIFSPKTLYAKEIDYALLAFQYRTRVKFSQLIQESHKPIIDDRTPEFYKPIFNLPFSPKDFTKANKEIEHALDEFILRTRLNYACTPFSLVPKDKDLLCIQPLLSNKDIILVHADKNIGLCLLDYAHYRTLVLNHLALQSSYQRIWAMDVINIFNRAFTRIEAFLNKYGKRLPKQVLKFLKSSTSRTAIYSIPSFRILPKLHKSISPGFRPNLDIRPIVGATNWITTKISIFLADTFQNFFVDKPQYPQNSTDIVNSLDGKLVLNSDILFSLDVVNLYGSMSPELTTYAVRKLLQLEGISLPLDYLVHIVFDSNIFIFEDQYYQQTFGMAMGTNMAVPIANVFLFIHLESHPYLLNKLETRISFYKRYVDDIMGIWKGSLESLLEFHLYMNTLVPGLKFTLEHSLDSLNVLDLIIFKQPISNPNYPLSRLHVRCHQKSLNRYSYITPRSHHPINLQRGFIKSELIRYVRNSSLAQDFFEIRAKFFLRLRARGYSAKFIANIFKAILYADRDRYLIKKPPPSALVLPFVIRCNKRLSRLDIPRLLKIYAPYIDSYWTDPPLEIIYSLKTNDSLGKLMLTSRQSNVKIYAEDMDLTRARLIDSSPKSISPDPSESSMSSD